MRSTELLPGLSQLPPKHPRRRKSHGELLTDLARSEPALQAADATAAASLALWGIYPHVNVDDRLFEAYELAYPGLAADHSLHEHYLRVTEEGEASFRGFVSGLKGKLAELHAKEALEQHGYTNVEVAGSATQSVWDISAVGPSGQPELFQVKTGAATYASDVAQAMEAHPDVHFMVSSEVYERVSDPSLGQVDKLTDLGYDDVSVETIVNELTQLSEHMGLDITDRIGDVIPYLGPVLVTARVTYTIVKTEREFKHVTRRSKNRIQIARNVPLILRYCIFAFLALLGGAVGSAAFPPVGTFVGLAGGIVLGWLLIKRIHTPVQRLVESTVGLRPDDLFYYRHKPRIDDLAKRFQVHLAKASELGSLD